MHPVFLKIGSFNLVFLRSRRLIGVRHLIEKIWYVITWRPYPYTKCSIRDIEKASNKFHQEAQTITIFLCKLFNKLLMFKNMFFSNMFFLFFSFYRQSIKTSKSWPKTFSSFNFCPSLPSVVTDNRKQVQCLNYSLQ